MGIVYALLGGLARSVTAVLGESGRDCGFVRLVKTTYSFRKNASTDSYISDGPINYSAASKCIWIIEGSDGPLVLRLDEFFTECCWGMSMHSGKPY